MPITGFQVSLTLFAFRGFVGFPLDTKTSSLHFKAASPILGCVHLDVHTTFESHFSTDRFCKFPFARDGENSTFLAASSSTVSIKGKTKVLKLISLAECKGRTCAVWATPGAGHHRLSGEKGPGEGSLPRVSP